MSIGDDPPQARLASQDGVVAFLDTTGTDPFAFGDDSSVLGLLASVADDMCGQAAVRVNPAGVDSHGDPRKSFGMFLDCSCGLQRDVMEQPVVLEFLGHHDWFTCRTPRRRCQGCLDFLYQRQRDR